MKKVIALFLFVFAATASAQYVSTPNIGLEIPANGSTSWNVPLNFNFNLIDQLMGGLNNDVINLMLKPAFGSGSPAITCGTANQGQLYFNTAASYAGYVCNTSAWYTFASGTGGGATFYANSIQYATSTTTARAVVPTCWPLLVVAQAPITSTAQLTAPVLPAQVSTPVPRGS